MDDQKESEVGVEDVVALFVIYQTDKTPLIIDFYIPRPHGHRVHVEVGITRGGIEGTDGSRRSLWGMASVFRGYPYVQGRLEVMIGIGAVIVGVRLGLRGDFSSPVGRVRRGR